MGRLDAAAVEGSVSHLPIGPSDAPSQQLALTGHGFAQETQDTQEEQVATQQAGMQQTPLTYKDGVAPTHLSFRWQLIQDKNGARNRKYILLKGPVEGEFLHDYVKTHGWTKYIVTTTQEGSVALIMESGGKRIQPPRGVQQGGPMGQRGSNCKCHAPVQGQGVEHIKSGHTHPLKVR